MSNALKYIKNLEAVGFQREQAEAQVQMVLDAIEGDLVTKNDLELYKVHSDNRLSQTEMRLSQTESRLSSQISQLQKDFENQISQLQESVNGRFAQFQAYVDNRFAQFQASIDSRLSQIDMRFKEMELNLTVRLGLVAASVATVSVAVLSWVIKS